MQPRPIYDAPTHVSASDGDSTGRAVGGGAAAERRADAAQRDVVSDAGGAASERAAAAVGAGLAL